VRFWLAPVRQRALWPHEAVLWLGLALFLATEIAAIYWLGL
jgi:hypothetical protein